MAGNRSTVSSRQFLDNNGDPAGGAKARFFITGTSTPLAVFSDSALTSPILQPITADGNGRFTDIFLQQLTYKAEVKDTGETITFFFEDPHSNILQVDFTGIATIATYAAARAIAGATLTADDRFFMEARATLGDGGHGDFRWDAASVEADNDMTILKLTDTVTGRLKRDFSGAIDARWRGATADNGTTNNTPIFQAIHDAFTDGVAVVVPVPTAASAFYGVAGTFTISKDNFAFMTDGAIVRTSSVTLDIILMQGTAAHPNDLRGAKVTGFTFEGTGVGSTATAIHCDRMHECTITGNRFGDDTNKIGEGVKLDGTTDRDVDNNIITDNHFIRTASTGMLALGTPPAACEENIIAGNTFTGCGGNGLSCTGNKNEMTGNTIEESVLTNLVITGNNNTITGGQYNEALVDGINCSGDLNSFNGVCTKDNGGDGVQFTAAAIRNSMTGGTNQGNTGFGVNNAGASNVFNGVVNSDNVAGQFNQVTTNAIYAHNFDTADTIEQHIVEERVDAILTVNSATTAAESSGTTLWDLDNDVTVPPNAKAVILEVRMRDSGSGGADANVRFIPPTLATGHETIIRAMPANDRWNSLQAIMEMDTANRMNIIVSATGAGTLEYELRLVGWVLR